MVNHLPRGRLDLTHPIEKGKRVGSRGGWIHQSCGGHLLESVSVDLFNSFDLQFVHAHFQIDAIFHRVCGCALIVICMFCVNVAFVSLAVTFSFRLE